jgi:hypothetical protein
MHLSPAATEDAIRLLDGRDHGPAEAGHYTRQHVVLAEKSGDILDTRKASAES